MAEPPPSVMYFESPRYGSMYRQSVVDPGKFWGGLARSMLTWIKDFEQVMDCDMEAGKIRWFLGGKLNVSVNCLDRHDPRKVALIWEKEDPGKHEAVTYGDLLKLTCQSANVLKKLGVKKGMYVAICVSMHPLAVAFMLACARIGAVHCVINLDCGVEGVKGRINIVQAQAVIVGGFEGKEDSTANLVDALQGCPTVKLMFVAASDSVDIPKGDNCVLLIQSMAQESTECEPEPMDSTDTLCVIFTSGTTDVSKPIMHTQAGYLLQASVIFKYAFDFHSEDIFGCSMSLGWIGSHTCTVYGPLCIGGTSLLFGGSYTHPDPGRYWEIVERLKLTHFFPPVNHLRQLEKAGDEYVRKYDRSTLRVITSAGNLVPESTWQWCCKVVGGSSAAVIQTWGQTECLGILWSMWAPSDEAHCQEKPVCLHSLHPFFGVDLAILEEETSKGHNSVCTFHEISPSSVNVPGLLCFKKPFPGLAKGLRGEVLHADFLEKHFKRIPGYYVTEDVAQYDQDGNCRILGREADMIDCHGKRKVARMEIEYALESDDRVSAAAVVGYPSTDGIGEGVCAFVVSTSKVSLGDENGLRQSLRRTVGDHVGLFAGPDVILFVEALPLSYVNKTVHWVLQIAAAFFARRLEKEQKQCDKDSRSCRAPEKQVPLSFSLSIPGSLATVLAPVIGDEDALMMEQKLLRSNIVIKNFECFYKILEALLRY